MSENIHYHVKLLDPNAHLFEVTCTVPSPNLKGSSILPAWIPVHLIVSSLRILSPLKLRMQTGSQTPKDRQRLFCRSAAGPLKASPHYAWDLRCALPIWIAPTHFSTVLVSAPEGQEAGPYLSNSKPVMTRL